MMRSALRSALTGLTIVGLLPGMLSAQDHADLDKRVQPPLRPAALRLLASATTDNLPTYPLVDKLLEGVSKGAPNEQILSATERLYKHLQVALKTLGRVPEQDLVSAAAVLRAGAPPATLTTLQKELPKRSLAVPFSVLGVMLQQGVPLKDALRFVITKSRNSDDKLLIAMGQSIERSVAAGLPPTAALVQAERIKMPDSQYIK